MKKLLAIVVLGLLLTSCAANSYLEYRYKTGGQLSSHSVSGWTDEEMVIKASQECMKFNKNARAKNVIKRYEGGLGKILGEGGEYDIWIYDCYIPDKKANNNSMNSTSSMAKNEQAFINAALSIDAVLDASFVSSSSFFMVVDYVAGMDWNKVAEYICGGRSKYGLGSKYFGITVFNTNKSKIGKAYCK
jgi:hypothetical protein